MQRQLLPLSSQTPSLSHLCKKHLLNSPKLIHNIMKPVKLIKFENRNTIISHSPTVPSLIILGIGLFSYSQLQKHDSRKQIVSSSPHSPPQISHFLLFSVSYKMGNLKTQLLHGGQESELESAVRRRIMSFLNIPENDYCMVFTAKRTSAFKLVAESYPFQYSQKILTVMTMKVKQ